MRETATSGHCPSGSGAGADRHATQGTYGNPQHEVFNDTCRGPQMGLRPEHFLPQACIHHAASCQRREIQLLGTLVKELDTTSINLYCMPVSLAKVLSELH